MSVRGCFPKATLSGIVLSIGIIERGGGVATEDDFFFSSDQKISRHKEPGVLKDSAHRGLRLEVSIGKRSGALRKVWIYRYRTQADGRLRQIKLGEYPMVSLSEARDRWRKEKAIRDDPERGDPRQERKKTVEAVKDARQQENLHKYSVRELCEHYLAEHVDKQRKKPEEPHRMFRVDVFKHALADKPAIEVRRADIHELIQGVIQRGAGRIAQMLRRELLAAFDHAVAAGRLPDERPNPCLKVKAPSQVRRNRAFSEHETEKFLAWLPTAKLSRTVKDAMMLELLTTARQGEIVSMEWKHIDLPRGVWTQPTSKNNTRHEVMLSDQAVSLLEERKGLHPLYVFPRPDRKGCVASKAIGIQQWAAKASLAIDSWTVHDLRRSAITGLSRMGCPRSVQNRISNHVDSSIQTNYDIYDFDKEAREWLKKWADKLDQLKPVET
jgi:integrase